MVVQSGFRVSLHNPDTGMPHKEFNKDGKTYVEAYPDAQYFIDIELIDRNAVRGAQKLEAYFVVDEQDLGYDQYIPLNGVLVRTGLWTSGGENRALAFARSEFNAVAAGSGIENDADAAGNISIYSQIIVYIHESIEETPNSPCPTLENNAASLTSTSNNVERVFSRKENVNFNVTAEEAKVLKDRKVIRSIAGTATLSPSPKKPKAPATATATATTPTFVMPKEKQFRRGPHLATIELNYCSTVGLIMAGVLPKPYEGWKPGARSQQAHAPTMDMGKIPETITTYKDDFGLEHQAVQFDLTGLSDDEEDKKKAAVEDTEY